jgi:regulator of RNase E activity RraA
MTTDEHGGPLTEDLVRRLRGVKVADLADGARNAGVPFSAAGPELRPAVPYSSLIGVAMPVRCSLAPGDRSYTDQVLELYERGLPLRHAIVVQQNDVPGFTSIGSGGAKIAGAHGYAGWITSGAMRDTDDLRGMPWPVYGTSIVPAGRRVVDVDPGETFLFTFDEPVDIAGMRVAPGDIVIGDNDGVIAFAPEHLAVILDGAEAILRLEHRYYRLIDEGRTFREIVEADRAAGSTE